MTKELKALQKIGNAQMNSQYFIVNQNEVRYRIVADDYLKELKTIEKGLKEKAKQDKVLEIIKSFNCYTIEEIQGQSYLMMGTMFLKSPKIPISKENALLLKEYFK